MAFKLWLELDGIDQYMLYVHQHKDIYPDDGEPYGLHTLPIKGHDKVGYIQNTVFVIKDHLMKGIPRKKVPCRLPKNGEDIRGYLGGIGSCIEGKGAILYITLKVPWTLIVLVRFCGRYHGLQVTMEE